MSACLHTEQWALDGRKTTELLNVVDGRMYIPARGGHPKKAVVFDDIYYGYLIWKAYVGPLT